MSKIIYFSDFLKNRFGTKVHKVSFRLGNTCPNRDGKISYKGCIYCNGKELVPHSYKEGMNPVEQVKAGIEVVKRKYKADRFIAYLQDNTGTYGNEDYIMESIERVMLIDGVIGISVGTRADCISERFYNFFEKMAAETFLMTELGVQSINEETLNIINRGHNVAVVEEAFNRLNQYGIHTVAHIIIGLMNDGEDDLRKLALWLSEKNVSGVKIHNIVVLRDTVLGDRFFQGEFSPPSRERLLELYRIFFESIRHNIVVHRLITDADKRFIIAPEYALDKNSLIRDVRKVTEAIL